MTASNGSDGGVAASKPKVLIRQATADEKHICHSIRQRAWEVAYGHIYPKEEIDEYFHGKSSERRTWSAIPCAFEESLVAEVLRQDVETKSYDSDDVSSKDNNICGFAKWGWTPGETIGELHSLYVATPMWNSGTGSMLWDAIVRRCREEGVTGLDIWVLQRARSSAFYVKRGCFKVGCGDYIVGNRKEIAECYRWSSSHPLTL